MFVPQRRHLRAAAMRPSTDQGGNPPVAEPGPVRWCSCELFGGHLTSRQKVRRRGMDTDPGWQLLGSLPAHGEVVAEAGKNIHVASRRASLLYTSIAGFINPMPTNGVCEQTVEESDLIPLPELFGPSLDSFTPRHSRNYPGFREREPTGPISPSLQSQALPTGQALPRHPIPISSAAATNTLTSY